MKNKEITIYELMGLIKDGKAPKKIKYNEIIYQWIAKYNGYLDNYNKWDLFYKNRNIADIINTKVEILPEENDEWEDIGEINIENEGNGDFIKNEYGTKCGLTKHSKIIAEKVNQLIKNQKYLKEKLESQDES